MKTSAVHARAAISSAKKSVPAVPLLNCGMVLTMTEPVFSYPPRDEDTYLSWFRGSFSSVFVAINPFLKISDVPLNSDREWIPDKAKTIAKQRGVEARVSWEEIAELCGFPSIAHVNRALRLTGSRRISSGLACAPDTGKMLNVCKDRQVFIPDEGRYSPLVQIALTRFFKQLGQDEVIVAGYFGSDPRVMKSDEFSSPDGFAPPEIYTQDRSVYLSIYIDYHYFLVCQTEHSLSVANPADFFEGFFADENTNDLWGVGDPGDDLNAR